MPSLLAFILLFASAVLAKKGGGGSSSSGSGSSSSSSSGGGSDSVTASDFEWTPSLLSGFILAIIYGAFTLLGGGYWLAKRYNPAVTAAGLTALFWSTWLTWTLSVVYYTLAATWRGLYAHALAEYYYDISFLSVDTIANVAGAIVTFSDAGWMLVLLGHTHTIWRTSNTEVDRPRPTHWLFYITFISLLLSAIIGGIAYPALYGSYQRVIITFAEVKIEYDVFITYYVFTVISPCLLLAVVLMTRSMTRRVEGGQSFDPLRWILFIAVPLWIVAEFVPFVMTAIEMANLPGPTYYKFSPALLLDGIATLATIALLPSVVVNAKQGKELEA
ncbi:hypothetical protein DL96DRAFT_1558462 [Flagelloscypha sp. PMI_526]|nr:hypothetical protein DL96DRAFT_1558462 [Flagelloscypha sp. PMI_526]